MLKYVTEDNLQKNTFAKELFGKKILRYV